MNTWVRLLLIFLFFLPITRASASVVINELLPKSSDPKYAWIELYNSGSDTISLDRWRLMTTNGSSFMFNASARISPKGFLTIYQSQTGLFHNIDGDTITLFDDTQSRVDTQSYPGTLGFNTSMGRPTDGGPGWTICTPAPEYIGTPNATNKCPAAPTATPIPSQSPISTKYPLPTSTPYIPTEYPKPTEDAFIGGVVQGATVILTPTPTPIPDIRETTWYSTMWTVVLIAGVTLGSFILVASMYRDFIRRR